MRTQTLFRLAFILLSSVSLYRVAAQTSAPNVEWQKSFGGTLYDEMRVVRQTTDGGYILGGTSGSNTNGNKTSVFYGGNDYWVIKLDASGNKVWENTYGGSFSDQLWALQQTTDGGYILGGYSDSPVTGNKTSEVKGDYDFWIVRIDSAGTVLWDKSYGGTSGDKLFALEQTSDGGFVLAGTSKSGISADKASENFGSTDYWVIKVDSAGTLIWQQTFGGDSDDDCTSLCKAADGGFLIGGGSGSDISGNKTNVNYGSLDYWVVKVDSGGNQMWQTNYGGYGYDRLEKLQSTSDGGFVLAGTAYSPISGNKITGEEAQDFWVIKLNAAGVRVWEKQIYSPGSDTCKTIIQTSDGGFLVGGMAGGFLGDERSATWHGSDDFWVAKLNASGQKTWDQSAGGSNIEELYSVQETSDGGFILGGLSYSGITGNKGSANFGVSDFWVVKLQGRQPIVLTNAAAISGNQFRFTVTGPEAAQVIIQESSSLNAWTSLSTNVLTGGSFAFTNTSAGSFRFYRVLGN